jgi:hypothetical protein
MSIRLTTLAVAVAVTALFVAVAPAFATEDVPPPVPPGQPGQPGQPTLPPAQPKPNCVDTMRPTSKLVGRVARTGRVTTLRGTTRDLGCSLSGLGVLRNVQVSLAQLKAGRCQFVAKNGKRSLWRKCAPARWMRANASSNWTLRLRKPLRHGSYLVRVRAVDSARNVEKPRNVRLTIR